MDVFTPNPLSAMLVPAFDSQAVDLVWKIGPAKGVVGYHIWRAQGAPSNFIRITEDPLQTTFFRDITRIIPISETPAQWVSSPSSSDRVVAIRTRNTPLAGPKLDRANKPLLASSQDVRVTSSSNPGHPFQIERVDANSGLIVFGNKDIVNDTYDHYVTPDLPIDLASLVVEYFYIDRFTDSTFSKDLYYVITEVFEDGSEGDLKSYPAISNLNLDPADIFWREAMRRNRFIFEQVGEPAYVILRKTTGKHCSCVDTDTMKPRTTCMACWGVGYEGGYDGPYPITFTPPNAASQVKQGPEGRVKTRAAQSFIGPTPILSSGDIIFRFTGERLVVLDVERTTIRGTTLQQSYNAELLKPSDYRNKIQVTNRNYPIISISTDTPAFRNTDISFEDPIPTTISLHEGVSSVEISDPAEDITKIQTTLPGNIRTNTQPSISPVFENWNF